MIKWASKNIVYAGLACANGTDRTSKGGGEVVDNKRSGRPVTRTTRGDAEMLNCALDQDRRVKIHDLCKSFGGPYHCLFVLI